MIAATPVVILEDIAPFSIRASATLTVSSGSTIGCHVRSVPTLCVIPVRIVIRVRVVGTCWYSRARFICRGATPTRDVCSSIAGTLGSARGLVCTRGELSAAATGACTVSRGGTRVADVTTCCARLVAEAGGPVVVRIVLTRASCASNV